VPGPLGGASTKCAHLIRLLHTHYKITVVVPEVYLTHDKDVLKHTRPYAVNVTTVKSLPKTLSGVALGICDSEFFRRRTAHEMKDRGLKIVWSNEMMFPFHGEAEAVHDKVVDRVLFVSDFQKEAFYPMYGSISAFMTGNFIDPEAFPYVDRKHAVFTIGRLSRADVAKYPMNFPLFYECLELGEVRYRVMAWNSELAKKFRWHNFDSSWELLGARHESAHSFLSSLDLFVYPLGHQVKESWGRAVVEAMLTGCIPLVPTGHSFGSLIENGISGFICDNYLAFKDNALKLRLDYAWRKSLSKQCSEFARQVHCNAALHKQRWLEALTF